MYVFGGKKACAVKVRERRRRWHAAHREQENEQARRRYAADRERVCEKRRNHYANLSGREYSRVRLMDRRNKALARMAERKARLAEDRLEASSG